MTRNPSHLAAAVAAVLTLTLVRPLTADGIGAYFEDKNGKRSEIEEPWTKNKNEKWLGLAWDDYTGARLTVAVMPVLNQSAGSGAGQDAGNSILFFTPDYNDATVPVAGIEELLTTSLLHTNHFRVMDRKAIVEVLDEQDLGASGRVAQKSAPEIGKILGVKYLVLVAVNEWKEGTKGVSAKGGGITGNAGKIVGGFMGGSGEESKVVLSMRLVDATSSEVLFSETLDGITKKSSFDVGALGITGSSLMAGVVGLDKDNPVTEALVQALNKGVYLLAKELSGKPWSGAVAAASGDKIYINAGSNAGMVEGMKLTVFAAGEEITDPDTGEVLDIVMTELGRIEVTEVREKVSIARVLSGCDGVKKGDRVELSD